MPLRDVLYIRVEAPTDMTADEFAVMRDIATSATVSSVGKMGVDVWSYATLERPRAEGARVPFSPPVCANEMCGKRGHVPHSSECRVELNFAWGGIRCGCTTKPLVES